MTEQPLISVIIVNLDGRALLGDCRDSVLSQEYPQARLEVIVVDNGSSDESVPFVREAYPQARVIEAGRNLGFAAGTHFDTGTVPVMPIYGQVVERCKELGLLDRHSLFGDWIPYHERGDYLLEADLAVSAHKATAVFAHVNAPHDPFVFGADGWSVGSEYAYTYDEFVEAYREQAAFVSWTVQQPVEEILSSSPEPPIVIVQGDHGACYGPYEENLADRVSILNAYYFPDQGYEDLYQTISPVNTFRVVLNRFFGRDCELLEDRSYYSKPEFPHDHVDVTGEVAAGF